MKKIVIGILACVVMLLSACGRSSRNPWNPKRSLYHRLKNIRRKEPHLPFQGRNLQNGIQLQLKNHRTIWKDLHHLRKHKLKIPPRRLFRQSRPKHRIPPIRPKQLHRLFQKAQSPFQLRLQKWRRRPQWNPNLLQNLSRNKIRNTLLIKILISIFGSVMRRIMGKVWG